MKLRTCTKCNTEKSIEEFHFKNKAKGIRRTWCRECASVYHYEWYKKNRVKRRSQIRLRKEEVKEKIYCFLYEYLKQHPCTDCGETNPFVLEFHHINEKRYTISYMAASALSIDSIKEEISKCIVLCANCHRLHTFSENGGASI